MVEQHGVSGGGQGATVTDEGEVGCNINDNFTSGLVECVRGWVAVESSIENERICLRLKDGGENGRVVPLLLCF